jgi:hypothetical protein
MHKALLLAVLVLPLAVMAGLPQPNPVPGGIAIIAVVPDSAPAPLVQFQKQRVLVVRANGMWQAVVGLPLSLEPGEQRLDISDRGAAHTLAFQVLPKQYETQYLTLANKRQRAGASRAPSVCGASSTIRRASRIPDWTSPHRKVRRLRRRRPASSSKPGITSSMAARCSSIMARGWSACTTT